MLGTAIAAVDVDDLTKVIPYLLNPCYQSIINQNRVAFATLALEFVQPEVLGQLDLITSFVLLDHCISSLWSDIHKL